MRFSAGTLLSLGLALNAHALSSPDELVERSLRGLESSFERGARHRTFDRTLPHRRPRIVKRASTCQATTTTKAVTTTKAATTTKTTSTTTTTTAAPTNTVAVGAKKAWTKIKEYSGSTFFDDWTFWTASDPTSGTVTYVDEATAASNELIGSLSNGTAVMSLETTATVSSTRKSVRIQSNMVFTGGLVLLDAVHIPTGCGTWPAFWSYGPDWPYNGEIDMMEAISDETVNQYAIHTGSGCSLPTSDLTKLGITTSTLYGATDCYPYTTNGGGCGIRDTDTRSFGPGFNKNGGGVIAMIWVTEGIQVWFFPRGAIPSDITAGTPTPSKWSQAQLKAFWPSTDCTIANYFNNHQLVFDTTLCGDWAGNTWSSTDGGVAGQEQSCAARTGYSTCEAFVKAQGGSFSNAYWEVNYVKVYQDASDSTMSHTL